MNSAVLKPLWSIFATRQAIKPTGNFIGMFLQTVPLNGIDFMGFYLNWNFI